MKSARYLSFILLFLFSGFQSYATHMLGGELQVFATSTQKQYTVRLTLYRDCSGIPLCSGTCGNVTCSQSVTIQGVTGAYAGVSFGTTDLNFKSVDDLRSYLCPSASTICDNMGCKTAGTLTPGVERYVFEGIVNLDTALVPNACEQVSIAWTSCCRNGIITTGSSGEGFYIEAVVNKNITNSTPEFANEPFLVLCGGVPFIYNMGAWDVDGDSLSFGFAPAFQAQNTPVDYTPPYTYSTPITWVGPASGTFPAGIKCDAKTGDVMFTPVNGGSTFAATIALEIIEWRKINGVNTVISKTRRDFQASVISCGSSNNSPRFVTSGTSTPNTAVYDWKVCEGSTICFDIIAKDTDATDTTTLTFDSLLINMGATITPKYSTRQREDAYTFCWTPPVGSANSVPYHLFPTAKDSRCPYPGRAQRVFYIAVAGSGNIAIQKNVYCDQVVLTHTGTLRPSTTRQWKVSLTPGVYDSLNLLTGPAPVIVNHFEKAGRYPVRLYLFDTCATRILYDTIVIKNAVSLNVPNDTSLCFGGHSFTLQPKTPVPSAVTHKWYLLPDSTVVIGTLPQLPVTASSNLVYMLRVTDTSGCTYYDYAQINVSTPSAIFSVNNAEQCLNGNHFLFTNQSLDSNGFTMNYLWSISDSSQSSVNDSLVRSFNSHGTYTVKLKATSYLGCIDSVIKSVSVFPMPKTVFLINDSIQCLNGNQFVLTNNSTIVNDSLTHTWSFGNNSGSSDRNPSAIGYQQRGQYSIKLMTSSSHGCKDSLTKSVTVNASPVAIFYINNSIQCFKYNSFVFTNYSTIPVGALSQNWYLGDGNTVALPSPQYKYKYLNPGLYPVKLVVTSDKGCSDSITHQVVVNPSPVASFLINDNIQCANDTFIFTNTSVVSNGGFTSKWNTGDNQSSSQENITHVYNNPGSYAVRLIIASDSLCYDTTVQAIIVYDRPVKPVISGNTVAVKHSTETYTVLFDSGSVWQWFIAGDSSHSILDNAATVQWGNKDTGYIAVTETNANGCVSDTAYAIIQIQLPLGIQELNILNTIQWYPVPAKDVLYFSSSTVKINHIRLYNLEGKELVSFSGEDILRRELPLKNISTGIYLLKEESDNNTITKKISIVK